MAPPVTSQQQQQQQQAASNQPTPLFPQNLSQTAAPSNLPRRTPQISHFPIRLPPSSNTFLRPIQMPSFTVASTISPSYPQNTVNPALLTARDSTDSSASSSVTSSTSSIATPPAMIGASTLTPPPELNSSSSSISAASQIRMFDATRYRTRRSSSSTSTSSFINPSMPPMLHQGAQPPTGAQPGAQQSSSSTTNLQTRNHIQSVTQAFMHLRQYFADNYRQHYQRTRRRRVEEGVNNEWQDDRESMNLDSDSDDCEDSPPPPQHRRLSQRLGGMEQPPLSIQEFPASHSHFRYKIVCNLHCRYCTKLLCVRGMKAILLADTKVELYSTDTPPAGVALVNQDYVTENCRCRIHDVGCLGCGNVVGYHVTQPCEACLDSCNNGHFWMFQMEGVVASERTDQSGTKPLLWAFLPLSEKDSQIANSIFGSASEARQAALQRKKEDLPPATLTTDVTAAPSTTRSSTPPSARKPSSAGNTRKTLNNSELAPITSPSRTPTTTSSSTASARRPILPQREEIGSPQSRKNTTHQEIERIKAEREGRRRKHAEIRKINESLTEAEKLVVGYKTLIDKFRQTLNLAPDAPEEIEGIWKADDKDIIKVVVRKRPMNNKGEDLFDIVTGMSLNCMLVHEPKAALDLTQSIDTHSFNFDGVYGENATSTDIYYSSVEPMVQSFLRGSTSTFIAYGQTGSGKTHTVFGTRRDPGIVLLMLKHILESTNKILSISFYEVYANKIYDLLQGRRNVQLLEVKNGCVLQGLYEHGCISMDDCLKVLDVGMKSRITAATEANPMSSRSHAILQMKLYSHEKDIGTIGPGHPVFSVVDLAGSEKANETNVRDKTTLMEGAEINKSLLALKECIRALNTNASHIPFRGSKLTMLLRESLDITSDRSTDGYPKKMVLMCATIRPTNDASEYTLNTLRYANRLKEISGPTNQPVTVDRMVYNPLDIELNDKKDFEKETPQKDEPSEEHETIAQSEPTPRPPVRQKKQETKITAEQQDAIEQLMMSHLDTLQKLLRISQTKEEPWLSNTRELSKGHVDKYINDMETSIEDKIQALLQLKEDLIFFKSL